MILAYLENEKCDEDILKVGITKEELELVKNLNKFSNWKRNSPHINCTIDTNLKGESRDNLIQ